MNLQKIEQLIARFEEGKTSLEEENILKEFFSGSSVPAHLTGYKKIFEYYDVASGEKIPDPDFDIRLLELIEKEENGKKPVTGYLYPVLAIAASVVVLVGLYFTFFTGRGSSDTYSDPELAYVEARKILMDVSTKLNSGVEELEPIKEIENGIEELSNIKSFDQGLKNMKKISILDKSKDIITQKQ